MGYMHPNDLRAHQSDRKDLRALFAGGKPRPRTPGIHGLLGFLGPEQKKSASNLFFRDEIRLSCFIGKVSIFLSAVDSETTDPRTLLVILCVTAPAISV